MLLQKQHKHDKSFWYCQKKIINLMQDDGFDAATDYVRVGGKRWLLWFVLWFKIRQEQEMMIYITMI
jgi:hypothetical protein